MEKDKETVQKENLLRGYLEKCKLLDTYGLTLLDRFKRQTGLDINLEALELKTLAALFLYVEALLDLQLIKHNRPQKYKTK